MTNLTPADGTSSPENAPFYVNGKVNIGNTNGKVILQTFTFDALRQYKEIFKGQVPMCYLLWEGTYATDLTYTTPTGYADIIKFALDNGCHIIGPGRGRSISLLLPFQNPALPTIIPR